jgi:hypothetical protein
MGLETRSGDRVWRVRVDQRGTPGFDSVLSVIASVAEVDGQLRRRYSACILPVLFEHPLRLRLLQAERVSDRRPIALSRNTPSTMSRWPSSRLAQ